MYERLLGKQNKPTINEFYDYSGKCKNDLVKLNDYLTSDLKLDTLLRFPYGNNYGWGIKYFIKGKHICDVFAEKDAFTVMIRLTNKEFDEVYNNVSKYAQKYIDNKYSCGEGGWIHFRVIDSDHLEDVIKLINKKMNV